MSAPSFTPGPWIVLGNSVGGPAIYTADKSNAIADVRTCGGVHVGGPQHPETQANARLIAAAPDLLEALESYVTTMAIAGGGDKALFMAAIREADNKARAAIAKATGAQP